MIPTVSPDEPGIPAALHAALSPARLQPYLDACAGDGALALRLYEWNIVVSAAFWEVVAVTEVAMRNVMHDQLTAAYGAHWYDDLGIVDDRSLQVIHEAKRRAARGTPRGTTPTPGKVVSEMSFGAWVSLLDRGGYSTAARRRLHYHDTLWLPALQQAFPAGPGHQRKTNRGLRVVQSLRNRIGHHEKIFREPFKDTGLTLEQLHAHCIEVTGWISADAASMAAEVSRVRDVLTGRPIGT